MLVLLSVMMWYRLGDVDGVSEVCGWMEGLVKGGPSVGGWDVVTRMVVLCTR